MKGITVIGAGYVGLVTAVCFAELGHRVKVIERDKAKLASLGRGEIPFMERGLPELWNEHRADGNLYITDDYNAGLKCCELLFLTVGTPSSANGSPDLGDMWSAIDNIADTVSGDCILVIRSTVPVGTAHVISRALIKNCRHPMHVVSNPEFLREGTAIDDFMNPWRVVVGSEDPDARTLVASLYGPLGAPVILCDSRTAELSKYASNAFLATKVSFINEMAMLAENLGVDIKTVAAIMSLDPRCGRGYFSAGLGWGGSCLPKDVRAVLYAANEKGLSMPLLSSTYYINSSQPDNLVSRIESIVKTLEGKTVGILGLSFKPNTSDLREAPSMRVAELLKTKKCVVKVCDPVSEEEAAKIIPEITYCPDAYEVAENADVLVLATEWEEFKHLDMEKIRRLMNTPVLIDGRNLYDGDEMSRLGFRYEGIGSPSRPPRECSPFGQEMLYVSTP